MSDPARFIEAWEMESPRTLALLRALPAGQYDFRPDREGRSLGELAWHLAEIEAVMTHGIEMGKFEMGMRPPGAERPTTIEALAPGYERVHGDAVTRVRKLTPPDLEKEIAFFGRPMPVSRVLWGATLHHLIHHRGQLTTLCRLAGGTPPGMYGPTREETMAMRSGSLKPPGGRSRFGEGSTGPGASCAGHTVVVPPRCRALLRDEQRAPSPALARAELHEVDA